MAQIYTEHDVAINRSPVLYLNVMYNELQAETIDFQFPPRIVSDNKGATWVESEVLSEEPVAVFKGSGAREITLKTTYVVDGGYWTAERIHIELRKLRGYFMRYGRRGAARNPLVVTMKLLEFGGPEEMTGRFKNVSVRHSETLVNADKPNVVSKGEYDENTVGGGVFALRTDVTLDVRLWAKGAVAAQFDENGEPVEGEVKQQVKGLLNSMPTTWF